MNKKIMLFGAILSVMIIALAVAQVVVTVGLPPSYTLGFDGGQLPPEASPTQIFFTNACHYQLPIQLDRIDVWSQGQVSPGTEYVNFTAYFKTGVDDQGGYRQLCGTPQYAEYSTISINSPEKVIQFIQGYLQMTAIQEGSANNQPSPLSPPPISSGSGVAL